MKKKYLIYIGIAVVVVFAGLVAYFAFYPPQGPRMVEEMPQLSQEEEAPPEPLPTEEPEKKDYIKWVEFGATDKMLLKAYEYDVKSYGKDVKLDWIELLAYSVAKNWGEASDACVKDIDACAKKRNEGKTMEEITKDLKFYDYYHQTYSAVLSGFLGEYEVETEENGERKFVKKYGLKAFSPVAKGYSYSHYDDFGMARDYGYKRRHLGNDLLGSIGTPIIAVEGGTIEAMGWNQYGGWRVGIRSADKKRYYYYAHLRKNHPFNSAFKEGDEVKAGDVIGYLGMTGYSTKENVNNITTPHLHFGLQLIFDEKQKEGNNEIWIDVYHLVSLLDKNKCAVTFNEATKEYNRKYEIREVQQVEQQMEPQDKQQQSAAE